jgi:hypothetical protein
MMEQYSPDNGYNARITRLEAQVAMLEDRLSSSPNGWLGNVALKSQAAQTQAAQVQAQPPEGLYAPLRNDTRAVLDLAAFVRRLLNPDDLGFAVTQEVRDAARKALGLP